jgi:hypothetical protein
VLVLFLLPVSENVSCTLSNGSRVAS